MTPDPQLISSKHQISSREGTDVSAHFGVPSAEHHQGSRVARSAVPGRPSNSSAGRAVGWRSPRLDARCRVSAESLRPASNPRHSCRISRCGPGRSEMSEGHPGLLLPRTALFRTSGDPSSLRWTPQLLAPLASGHVTSLLTSVKQQACGLGDGCAARPLRNLWSRKCVVTFAVPTKQRHQNLTPNSVPSLVRTACRPVPFEFPGLLPSASLFPPPPLGRLVGGSWPAPQHQDPAAFCRTSHVVLLCLPPGGMDPFRAAASAQQSHLQPKGTMRKAPRAETLASFVPSPDQRLL